MLELILREWRLPVHERPSVMFVVGLRGECLRVVDWQHLPQRDSTKYPRGGLRLGRHTA